MANDTKAQRTARRVRALTRERPFFKRPKRPRNTEEQQHEPAQAPAPTKSADFESQAAEAMGRSDPDHVDLTTKD